MLNFKKNRNNDNIGDSGNENINNGNENDTFETLNLDDGFEDFSVYDDEEDNFSNGNNNENYNGNFDNGSYGENYGNDNANSGEDNFISFEDENFQETEQSFLDAVQNARENESEDFSTIGDNGENISGNNDTHSGKKKSLFSVFCRSKKGKNSSDEEFEDLGVNYDGSKRKNRGFTDISNNSSLSGTGSGDFVILDDKEEKNVGKIIGKTLKYILSFAFLSLLIVVAYFSVSYKIIPENVKGAKYQLGDNLTMISRDYTPNLDELKVGDTILTSETSDWMPFLISYKKMEVTGRNAYIVYVKDLNQTLNNTKKDSSIKIQSVDVDYILK